MTGLNTRRGFTLVELVIALAVAAVLLAWGVPSFQRFMDNTTLVSETNNWVGLLNHARNEAITRGERVTICRRLNPGNCDGTADCSCGVTQSGGGSPPNYHTGYLVFTSTGNAQPLNFVAASNELLRTGATSSDKITIQGNGQANNAFSFASDGTLAPEDVSAGAPPVTARHIVCVSDVAGDDTTAESTAEVPGRVVIISELGRPRVMEFEVGGDCYDANSSNTAADSAANYGN